MELQLHVLVAVKESLGSFNLFDFLHCIGYPCTRTRAHGAPLNSFVMIKFGSFQSAI